MLSDCIEWNIEDRKKNMINEHMCACLHTWAKQRKNYHRALKWNIKKKETDLNSQSPCFYSSHILLVLHLWTDVCSWTRVRSPQQEERTRMFWCRVNGVTAVSKESSSRSRKPEHQNESVQTQRGKHVIFSWCDGHSCDYRFGEQVFRSGSLQSYVCWLWHDLIISEDWFLVSKLID